MKTLIVVDMQNDFIDGSLGTKEAQDIVPKVAAKIREYRKQEIRSFSRGIRMVRIISRRRRARSFRWSIASRERRDG